jgi:RecA-family ATPase
MSVQPIDFSAVAVRPNGDAGRSAPLGSDAQAEAKPAIDSHDECAWKSRLVGVPEDWYSAEPPKRDWLLRDQRHPKARGVFPLGKVGQLIAEGGAGKTQALCQLAVAVATGGPWLGSLGVAPEGVGRVLLVLGEEDSDEARRRLFRAARLNGMKNPKPDAIEVLPLAGIAAPLLALDEFRNLVDTPFAHELRAHIAKGDFRLVVVDHLSRFAGPDAETDNASATRFIQSLEAACPGRTSLINSHHTNKLARGNGGRVEASGGRGSTALVDGARWQGALSVERLKFESPEVQERLATVVTFDVPKTNYAARPEPIVLRSDPDNGGALVPLDDADLELIRQARQDATRNPKTAQREDDRRKASAERAATEADRRAERTTLREESTRQRDADDDQAARELVTAAPDAPVRVLVARLKAARACGSTRAFDAIHRVRVPA